MGRHYNLGDIRTLLSEGFTDQELRRLCYDIPDFRPVYNELAANTGKDKLVDKLINYAEQKQLMEPLLALIKEHNPARYEKYQPYQAKAAIVHGDFVGEGQIVTGSNISASNIAIGHGVQGTVNIGPINKEDIAFEQKAGITPGSDFQALITQVSNSSLTTTAKQDIVSKLQTLQSEVEKGKTGDLRNVRSILLAIPEILPSLRQPMHEWLITSEHVDPSIKIVARRLLA